MTPRFTIHETTNYSMFKHLEFNREIDQKNLNKIKESIKAEGQKQPIALTSDAYIYDGQHRFMALRALGLPVWYYVNHGAKPQDLITVNQVRKGHTIRNLVWYYAYTGNLDCKRLLELQDEWSEKGFSESVIYLAFNSIGKAYQGLIRNNLYVVDEKFGVRFLNTLLLLKNKAGMKEATQAKFARALKSVIKSNKSFNTDELINKMERVKLHLYNKEADLRQEIVDVYNYKRKKEKIS